ncbi:MAG: hypothetical protein RIM80_04975 [Alphaproteobacteria bacterium]
MQTTGAAQPQLTLAPPPGQTARRRPALTWRLLTFLILVVAPTLATLVYTVFLAAPIYASEAAFAIRSRSSPPTMGGLGQLTAQLGVSSDSGNDLHAVRTHLLSSEALDQLEATDGYRSELLADHGDPLLDMGDDPSDKAVLARYRWMFDVRVSTYEQMVTLEARAYSPAAAQDAASSGLRVAEKFVNHMNARANEDSLRFSRVELEKARERVRQTRAALTDWRNANGSIDPSMQIETIYGNVSALETELSKVRAEVSSFTTPNTRELQRREKAIETQIQAERDRLTGSKAKLTPLISEYEALAVERELADRQYEAASTAYQLALQEVAQQRKYIVAVAAPSSADVPAFPRPLFYTACMLMASLAIYGIMLFGANVISDYRDR